MHTAEFQNNRHRRHTFLVLFVMFAAILTWVVASYVGEAQAVQSPAPANPVNGVAYGPFRTGQSPDQQIFPSLAEVQADMPLLRAVANGIRTYGCVGLETVITATAQVELPLTQGIWLSADDAASQAELACAVNAAAAHPHIQALVVGNEAILTGVLTVPQVCQFLADARTLSGLPVTTAEPDQVWLAHPELVDCVDYLAVNLHPYWAGVAAVDAATYVAARYEELQALAGDKPVVISEVGWPTAGAYNSDAHPGAAEQAVFSAAFLPWATATGVDWYWFEATDENWKCDNGRPAVECHWGLYTAERRPKPAQSIFAPIDAWLPLVANPPTPTPTHTGTSTPTATATPTPTATPSPQPACTITQPTNNATVTTSGNCVISVRGTVQDAPRNAYLDFYVYTNNWYKQNPVVRPPTPNGSWSASPIYLAGKGSYNNHTIRAVLHDSGGATIASCQVSGIYRQNDCNTP